MIRNAAAVVLAGGRGRRFGGGKPFAAWKGGTLVEASLRRLRPLFSDVMLCVKDAAAFRSLRRPGLRLVRDRSRLFHPLAGLAAGMAASGTPWVFVRGADMPFLSPSLVRVLWRSREGADAVAPLGAGGPEPLCAFYHRRTLPALRRALRRRQGMRAFLSSIRTRWVEAPRARRADPAGRSFLDADTREELARLRRRNRP